MTSRFDKYWTKAIVESYMTSDAYIDMGKRVVPRTGIQHSMRGAG